MSTIPQGKNEERLTPQYDPQATEGRIYRLWEESGFFNPDKLSGKREKTFTIVIPPPNVTGSLHMGHALNATIQDILVRKKRMEGYRTLWLPGTDHAGIATQNVVEKELKKEGKTRHDLGREQFIKRVWEWKEKYGNIILDQLKKLGSSMDWSRTRFTMDGGYQKAVETAFLHYYNRGWLYRAERVINWCPKDQTSLSDLELEYKEEKTTLYYIRYPFVEKSETQNSKPETNPKLKTPNSKFIVVATTRPETMLGDAAVAVHTKDERFKEYVGGKALLPIQNREIPIVADDAVEKEFGTGAVKVTPAHDLTDAEIAERHDLARHTVIDRFGKMTKEAGAICEGMKAAECRIKVVAELKKRGLIEKEEPYLHNVAVCYRCGAVIEPIPSLQWFLKMGALAKLAAEPVESGRVKFHDERWSGPYLARLANERDWTISRQLWWGHQLPVWYHEPKCVPRKGHEEDIVQCPEYVISAEEPRCEFCDAKFVRDPDVLDTWFSSALWPFAALGWPSSKATASKPSDLDRFYPTNALSTARDIINIWVAKMVFSGMEFMHEAPFTDVIIHATILTKDGKRMSKSLGTGVDPMSLIEKYGADATRFGIMWQAMGTQDIRWSEEHVVAGKKFANKVWNSARFVLQNLQSTTHKPQAVAPKTDEDKKIIERFAAVKKEVNDGIERFDFGHALHALHDFYWHEFCDKYLEAAKRQLVDAALRENTEQLLLLILSDSLKLLHPFMPFLSEALWAHMPLSDKKLLMVEEWPQ